VHSDDVRLVPVELSKHLPFIERSQGETAHASFGRGLSDDEKSALRSRLDEALENPRATLRIVCVRGSLA